MSLDFSFLDEGERSATPVIFLHAFPYHSGMWAPQRAALHGRARFVAFDARGLGTRSGETTAYMLEHTVDDLLRLLDHLALEKALLCGVSMGGYAALRAVARAPERVGGLFLSNTQAGVDSEAAMLGRAEGVRILHRQDMRAFVALQIKRQLSSHSQQRPQLLAFLERLTQTASPAGTAASLIAIATRSDQRAQLASIRVPTTIVTGEDDVITPPALAQSMAEQIPSAQLHVFHGTGHLANLEADEAFNTALLAWIERCA